MKNNIKKIISRLGLLRIINTITSNRITTLFYHGFSDGRSQEQHGLDNKFFPIDKFEQHIKICLKYGDPLSLQDLICEKKISRNAVVLTIDDGYANNYSLAYPLLKTYNFPATIFLTTGFIDRTTYLWTDWLEYIIACAPKKITMFNWNEKMIPLYLETKQARQLCMQELKSLLKTMSIGEIHTFLKNLEVQLQIHYTWNEIPQSLQPLTWDQVREMKQSGLVSFGGHTLSHPILSKCDREVQQFELLTSKQRIEAEINEPCLMFAYPNGKQSDYTQDTTELLKQAGYMLAVTTESGYDSVAAHDHYRFKRWGADIGIADLEFLVSGGSQLLQHITGINKINE